MYRDRDFGTFDGEIGETTNSGTINKVKNDENRILTPIVAEDQELHLADEGVNVTDRRFTLVSSPTKSSTEELTTYFSSEESDSEYTSAIGSGGNSSDCESGNVSAVKLNMCKATKEPAVVRRPSTEYQTRIDDLCDVLSDVSVFIRKELNKEEEPHEGGGDSRSASMVNDELSRCSDGTRSIRGTSSAEKSYENAEVQTTSSLESIGSHKTKEIHTDFELPSISEIFGNFQDWPGGTKGSRSATQCECSSSGQVSKPTLHATWKTSSTNCLSDRKKLSASRSSISKKSKTTIQLDKEFSTSKLSNAEITPQFLKQFQTFAKLTNTQTSGVVITKYKSTLWLKVAGLFDDNTFDETTTSSQFALAAGKKIVMNVYDYVQYLRMICEYSVMDINYIIGRLSRCSPPEKRKEHEWL